MSKKTILVVDDDPMFLQMIELYLSRQGYRVVMALNGSEGLKLAKIETPDIVILDVMMPGIGGYDVCKELRRDPETAQIPIIILSAKSLLADKIEGFRAGTDDYLTKPVELAELLARIKALLARSAQPKSRAGKLIVFWGAKGGLGVSTLVANVGVALAKENQDVLLLDLNPGFSTSAELFGLRPARSLADMLMQESPAIDQENVSQSIIRHSSGLRILFGGKEPAVMGRLAPEMTIKLLEIARQNADITLVDLPSNLHTFTQVTILAANRIILVTEGRPIALQATEHRIRWLLSRGFNQAELSLVLINRTVSSLVEPADKVREGLKINLLSVVPPAGEATYAAEEAGYPVLLHDSQNILTHSINRIAAQLTGRDDPDYSLADQAQVSDRSLLSKRRRSFQ